MADRVLTPFFPLGLENSLKSPSLDASLEDGDTLFVLRALLAGCFADNLLHLKCKVHTDAMNWLETVNMA